MNPSRSSMASLSRHACVYLTILLLLTLVQSGARAEDPPEFLLSWGGIGSGDGQFSSPFGIAASLDEFVYVADLGHDRIQKFTAEGVFVMKWGSTGSGPGQFESPTGVAVDPDGNVYVADIGNARIQKFDGNGTFITSWPPGGRGVAADPSGAYLYVVSGGKVRKYTVEGIEVLTWDVPLGTPGTSYLYGVAVAPSGHVYVTVPYDDKVYRYQDGSLISSWTGTGEGQLDAPIAIAVDADGRVYVGDDLWMRKYTASGGFLVRWGHEGSQTVGITGISGVAVDSDGHVYVLDESSGRIEKFGPPPTATVETTWGRIKSLYRR